MTRVLHIASVPEIGGIEKLLLDLSVPQSKVHEPGFFFAFGASGSFSREFEKTGLPVYFGGLKSGFDLRPKKFTALVRVFRRYEILHLHLFTPILLLAAAISRRKIVYTAHAPFAHARQWRWSDHVSYALMKFFLPRLAHHIVFNSEFTRKSLPSLDRHGRSSVVLNGIVLPDLVNIGPIERETEAVLEGHFIVGTACRFVKFKRVERLIEGFALFESGKEAKLLLVGDGAMRAEHESHLDRLGCRDKSVFTGFRVDVTRFQNRMDVYVFPSRHEPFGLGAIEALALGKPVIIFGDGGGIAEAFAGFAPQDVVDSPENLALRLEYYYQNRKITRQGAVDRIDFASRFDIALTSSKLDQIYEKVYGRSA